jgi:phosphatidate cytidylyltransferase
VADLDLGGVDGLPDDRSAVSEKTPGRAGRNLPAAVGVGAGLALLVVVPLFSPARWLFVGVVLVAGAVGTVEVVRALRLGGVRPPLPPLLAGGAAMVVLAYREGAEALLLGLLLTVLACAAWRLRGPAGALRDVGAAAFTASYVPFLIAFAAMLAVPGDGPRQVAAFVATVVCSDVGGYVAGVLWGKHPMAPSVSPKKSWEGFGGSVVACAVGGAVFFATLFDANPLLGVVYGLAVVCTATLGDLGESLLKRDMGIKDMGDLLPGHGGLMDRLDSLLPTAPVAWLLLLALT